MEVAAKLKYARISPRKARLVGDQIRGLPIDRALNILSFSLKKGGEIIKKIVESAIANAEQNEGADIDTLRVSKVLVDQGPTFKRMHARAKGRGDRITKRTCHITIMVSDSRE